MAITSANQLELLQTAEAVAREKMIDPGLVVEAMEESLARAAKSRYGAEMAARLAEVAAAEGELGQRPVGVGPQADLQFRELVRILARRHAGRHPSAVSAGRHSV